jgi:hypothetical protein
MFFEDDDEHEYDVVRRTNGCNQAGST